MRKPLIGLIFWIGISLTAGWIGSRFLPGEWYASSVKPSWNPPSFVFAPVWSVLYVLIGLAAWLVWRRSGFMGASGALGLFLFQLFLNALWSYLFWSAPTGLGVYRCRCLITGDSNEYFNVPPSFKAGRFAYVALFVLGWFCKCT